MKAVRKKKELKAQMRLAQVKWDDMKKKPKRLRKIIKNMAPAIAERNILKLQLIKTVIDNKFMAEEIDRLKKTNEALESKLKTYESAN